ncbi:MAG: tetratricopeptide repeat protein [Muribaculaceae bacterium]|nr:tetratricopeptide repeat protein [Muribaculaceae bacterium]
MKIKIFLSLALACGLMASAQTQGYKDGIEYYKAGQYDNARSILERTLNDAATDQSLANYYLGQVALQQGDKAAAKTYFDKGLALNPDNGYNYVGLGALDLLNGQASAADKQFSEGQKHGKKNSDLTIAIARAYYNADPVKYAKEIQKYIDKARKDSKLKEPSIYILEGDMLMGTKDFGGAAAKYENAILNDPQNSEGYVKYANAYFNVNKNYGIQKLEELLAQQPNSAMAQRELAEKYFLADYWKKASDLYGKYIQNPNHFPEDKARYAVLLYWGEKYPESLSVANEILSQDPSNFLMQRIRFLDQTAMKDYAAAIDNASKFFASNEGGNFTTNDYVTYAEALSGAGQDSLAVIQYEIAAERDPKNSDLLKNLSAVYNQNKQYAKSADTYAAYLEMQENPSPDDFYGMATRYLQAAGASTDTIQARELADKGIVYIKRLIDNPNIKPIPQFYQRLAYLNIAGNNKRPNAEAEQALIKMVALLDEDPANKDPKNPANQLSLYKNAYAFLQAYYSINKDADNHAKAVAEYNAINELINGGGAQ